MRKPALCYMRTVCSASQVVVRSLDSIISIPAIFKISRHKLAYMYIDERAALSLTWSQPPKTGFSRYNMEAKMNHASDSSCLRSSRG